MTDHEEDWDLEDWEQRLAHKEGEEQTKSNLERLKQLTKLVESTGPHPADVCPRPTVIIPYFSITWWVANYPHDASEEDQRHYVGAMMRMEERRQELLDMGVLK